MGDNAEVAELADALGSGPSGLTMPVEVQVLSSALTRQGLTAIAVSPFFCYHPSLVPHKCHTRRS
jgi:hypothetical protein